jgi:hypothetical protein
VIVRLTDAEHRALEEARAQLSKAGEEVTLEDMIHRIITEWTFRRAEAHRPAPMPMEGVLAHLRRLASAPLRTWRELGAAALRRLTGLAIDPV